MEKFTMGDFEKALKFLKIEDYRGRILASNSHGEMMHLPDYIEMAKNVNVGGRTGSELTPEDFSTIRKGFDGVVAYAEQNWERPESVFQHMLKIMSGGEV